MFIIVIGIHKVCCFCRRYYQKSSRLCAVFLNSFIHFIYSILYFLYVVDLRQCGTKYIYTKISVLCFNLFPQYLHEF